MKEEKKYGMKKNRPDQRKGFLVCDYCGELFVEGEPFCPSCGEPAEKIQIPSRKKGNEYEPFNEF